MHAKLSQQKVLLSLLVTEFIIDWSFMVKLQRLVLKYQRVTRGKFPLIH